MSFGVFNEVGGFSRGNINFFNFLSFLCFLCNLRRDPKPKKRILHKTVTPKKKHKCPHKNNYTYTQKQENGETPTTQTQTIFVHSVELATLR